MNRIDHLLRNYERYAALPWDDSLAGAQKVWFAVYNKSDERRIRARLGEFELATNQSGHQWRLLDLTNYFARWMSENDYRESYFAAPEDLELAYNEFLDYTASEVRAILSQTDNNALVALLGVATLFGFIRVSELIAAVQADIRGRLLVFFPGEYDANQYRLLDARDGWNYLAVPITSYSEEGPRR